MMDEDCQARSHRRFSVYKCILVQQIIFIKVAISVMHEGLSYFWPSAGLGVSDRDAGLLPAPAAAADIFGGPW